jgi:hypothetical protein
LKVTVSWRYLIVCFGTTNIQEMSDRWKESTFKAPRTNLNENSRGRSGLRCPDGIIDRRHTLVLLLLLAFTIFFLIPIPALLAITILLLISWIRYNSSSVITPLFLFALLLTSSPLTTTAPSATAKASTSSAKVSTSSTNIATSSANVSAPIADISSSPADVTTSSPPAAAAPTTRSTAATAASPSPTATAPTPATLSGGKVVLDPGRVIRASESCVAVQAESQQGEEEERSHFGLE